MKHVVHICWGGAQIIYLLQPIKTSEQEYFNENINIYSNHWLSQKRWLYYLFIQNILNVFTIDILQYRYTGGICALSFSPTVFE